MEEQWYNPFGGNQKRGREKKNSPRRRLITETYDLSHWENGPFQFFMTNLFDCATIKHIIMKPPKLVLHLMYFLLLLSLPHSHLKWTKCYVWTSHCWNSHWPWKMYFTVLNCKLFRFDLLCRPECKSAMQKYFN